MDKELESQADKIRKGFVSIKEDTTETNLSFLDEINELIRIILKDDPIDIYTLLTPEELARWKRARFKRQLKSIISKIPIKEIFYFILLSFITLFLVSESMAFYADGELTFKAFAQAILTELCFIFISGYRSDTRLQRFAVPFLRALMFSLMLFVITSEVALKGAKDISKIDVLTDRIQRIEKQIESTQKEIDYYKSIGWKNSMASSIKKRNELEKELQELKDRQEKESASSKVSSLLRYKIYGKAVFRVVLMLISVLITRRLFKF